jgi:hypothetical protein
MWEAIWHWIPWRRFALLSLCLRHVISRGALVGSRASTPLIFLLSHTFRETWPQFCHSAYVTWSHVELWSAHVPARFSYFCCRTHFVRRDLTWGNWSNVGFGHRHILTSQNVYYRTHIPVITQGVIKLPIHLTVLFGCTPKTVTLSPDICFCDKNRNYR